MVIVFVPSADQEECPVITTGRTDVDKSCGTLKLILSCTRRSGGNTANLRSHRLRRSSSVVHQQERAGRSVQVLFGQALYGEASVVGRGHALEFLKASVEVGNIVEAGLEANIGHRLVAIGQ